MSDLNTSKNSWGNQSLEAGVGRSTYEIRLMHIIRSHVRFPYLSLVSPLHKRNGGTSVPPFESVWVYVADRFMLVCKDRV